MALRSYQLAKLQYVRKIPPSIRQLKHERGNVMQCIYACSSHSLSADAADGKVAFLLMKLLAKFGSQQVARRFTSDDNDFHLTIRLLAVSHVKSFLYGNFQVPDTWAVVNSFSIYALL